MPTEPQPYKGILIINIVLLAVILLGGTFFLGMHTGTYRCMHESARRLRNVGFPQDMIREPQFMGKGLMVGLQMKGDGHGVAGEVLSIDGDTITVLGRDNTERTLIVGSGTQIGSRRDPQNLEDITIGSQIIGFGRPDEDGTVQVRHIVVMPDEIEGL